MTIDTEIPAITYAYAFTSVALYRGGEIPASAAIRALCEGLGWDVFQSIEFVAQFTPEHRANGYRPPTQ